MVRARVSVHSPPVTHCQLTESSILCRRDTSRKKNCNQADTRRILLLNFFALGGGGNCHYPELIKSSLDKIVS